MSSPRELLELHGALAPQHESVHRGQSSASQCTTRRFEAAYDDIARFVGAPSRNSIVVVRNTTEAINAVMGAVLAGSGEYRSQRLGVAALFPPDTLGERSLLAHRHILSRSLIGSPPRWMSGFPDGSRCY
jgi:hypothetical protein